MKRLGLITIAWKRPELTRVLLAYYQTLEMPGVELVGVVAKDPDDPDLRADLTRWWTVDYANSPRSDKWNASTSTLRRIDADVDGAFIIGSDDFLSAAYVDYVSSLREDYVSPTDCFFYSLKDNLAGYGRFDRVGAGRYLSREALEACDYEPWIPGSIRNSDFAMGQKIGQMFTPTMVSCRDMPVLDVKTGTNIWSYEAIRAAAPHWQEMKIVTEFPAWIDGHFPGLHEQLEKIRT